MDIRDVIIGMRVKAEYNVGACGSGYVTPEDCGTVLETNEKHEVLIDWDNPVKTSYPNNKTWWIDVANIQPYNKFKSWELLKLAEEGKVKQHSLYRDQEGNIMIYWGKSFQVYESEFLREMYVGLCVGDEWEFIGIQSDEEEE